MLLKNCPDLLDQNNLSLKKTLNTIFLFAGQSLPHVSREYSPNRDNHPIAQVTETPLVAVDRFPIPAAPCWLGFCFLYLACLSPFLCLASSVQQTISTYSADKIHRPY